MNSTTPCTSKAINALEFAAWAFGEINSNLKRAILAEFIVGKALGCLSRFHEEWNAYDLVYRGARIEVKSSGFGTPPFYPTKNPVKPKFDIAPRRWAWSNEEQDFIGHGTPERFSDVYVFAATLGVDATDFIPFDTEGWVFNVVPTSSLNEEFSTQRTISASALGKRFGQVGFYELRDAVDFVIREKQA